MTVFNQLQAQHEALLARQGGQADILAEVQDYIAQVRRDSQQVGRQQEREQLRANLRYWSAYVFERTGTYPNTELAPATVTTAEVSPWEAILAGPLKYVGLGILLFIFLCVLLLIFVIDRGGGDSGIPSEIETQNAFVVTQNAKVTQTIAALETRDALLAMTGESATSPTDTPLPTPTVTSSPTSTDTPTDTPDSIAVTPVFLTPTPTPISRSTGLLATPSGSEDRFITTYTIEPAVTIDRELALSLAFAPDGRSLAAAQADGSLALISLPSVSRFDQADVHQGWIQAVAYSPDGRFLASGGNDRLVRLWDARRLEEFATFAGHDGFVFSLAFDPAGAILASGGGDGIVNLWNIEEGRRLNSLTFETGAVYDIAFAPQGDTLAIASTGNGVQLRTVPDLDLLCRYSANALSIAISPDGQTLAVGTREGSVVLLSSQRCGLIATFDAHSDSVNSIAFSPDGGFLASGSRDGTIALYSLSRLSAAPLTLDAHAASVEALAFDPEGFYLASADAEGRLILWAAVE